MQTTITINKLYIVTLAYCCFIVEGFTNNWPALSTVSYASTASYHIIVKNGEKKTRYKSLFLPHASKRQDINTEDSSSPNKKKKIAIIGGGWGGLSVAHALSKENKDDTMEISIIESSKRVGGLVRDGYLSISGKRPAEAGQHGFWANYHNIFHLLNHDLSNSNSSFSIDNALTDYAQQGQYSPKGLEAVWPVYQKQPLNLPTGLAQAIYTKFNNLSILDRITAFPLVLAFSEFDNSKEAWDTYDQMSFRDLCIKLGVSNKCYYEAFEPMILTGLFAPGSQCSAAAALGMAYFFVLKSQESFDVKWCRGNIGNIIFDPWVEVMKRNNVQFLTSMRVTDFTITDQNKISAIKCTNTETGKETETEYDTVIFAVGAQALNSFVRNSPSLAKYAEFRSFSNLRGTSVLATRIFLDRAVQVPYSANACWGFDDGIGMTMFDISTIHGKDSVTVSNFTGSIIEVDYYHASPLLVMDNESIAKKVKMDLDTILGEQCIQAKVLDAAIVKLPNAVNWYYPGSYKDMPDLKSKSIKNLFFVGDIVKTNHGSWSQEKAYVTGMQVSNLIMNCQINKNIIPLSPDEPHVAFGRNMISLAKQILNSNISSRQPSFVDFLL